MTESVTVARSGEIAVVTIDNQPAIAKARPIIAGFDSQTRTKPVGGVGLWRIGPKSAKRFSDKSDAQTKAWSKTPDSGDVL